MVRRILVYYLGIIGIPGKGPNWIENYDPNKTLGDIIQNMNNHNLGEQNKRIEIFKFQKGNLNKFNHNNPHWPHNTKVSDYCNIMGENGNDVMLIYVIV